MYMNMCACVPYTHHHLQETRAILAADIHQPWLLIDGFRVSVDGKSGYVWAKSRIVAL